jgi:hypothetical protein
MSENTRVHDRFEYHLEDLDCQYCKFSKKKSKKSNNGCRGKACRYDDIRRDAISNKRIKRKRGHFTMYHNSIGEKEEYSHE